MFFKTLEFGPVEVYVLTGEVADTPRQKMLEWVVIEHPERADLLIRGLGPTMVRFWLMWECRNGVFFARGQRGERGPRLDNPAAVARFLADSEWPLRMAAEFAQYITFRAKLISDAGAPSAPAILFLLELRNST